MLKTTCDVDEVLKPYNIKYVQIESGETAIREKFKEHGIDYGMLPIPNYWCELSWGSGVDDEFDAAVNCFGMTLGGAISNCLELFKDLVKSGSESYVEIAKHYNIYDQIMSEQITKTW